jgi:hypothetical protein
MIDHDDARMFASARVDGELDPALVSDLDEHLTGCDACTDFAVAIPRLSALAAVLPRELAPDDLPARVGERLPAGAEPQQLAPLRRRRSWRVRLVPSFAAALLVVLVVLLVGPTPVVRLPEAEAADALARISTFFVEREIESNVDPESGSLRPGATFLTRERIWFKAPGSVRIERETTVGGAPRRTLQIERPGERYLENASGRFRETGLVPQPDLPEPLSPTISLLGQDVGAGPSVLGRTTRRVELRFDQEVRVAFVDAERFSVLGLEESVVLVKGPREGSTSARKRTVQLRYNPPLADSFFEIPAIAANDHGFRRAPIASLIAPPAGTPEGLDVVLAGKGPNGQAVLYAQGAFRVLVAIDAALTTADPSRRIPSQVGSRPAMVILSLYDLPRVKFEVEGHFVSVSAPLETDQLIALASAMYPE